MDFLVIDCAEKVAAGNQSDESPGRMVACRGSATVGLVPAFPENGPCLRSVAPSSACPVMLV
jgi:hypothetical protein